MLIISTKNILNLIGREGCHNIDISYFTCKNIKPRLYRKKEPENYKQKIKTNLKAGSFPQALLTYDAN